LACALAGKVSRGTAFRVAGDVAIKVVALDPRKLLASDGGMRRFGSEVVVPVVHLLLLCGDGGNSTSTGFGVS
jgi:hypothetical protein